MTLYKGHGTTAAAKGAPKLKGATESPRRLSNIRGAKHGRRDVVSFLQDKLGDTLLAANNKKALAQVMSGR